MHLTNSHYDMFGPSSFVDKTNNHHKGEFYGSDPWIILSTRDVYHMLGHIWCTIYGDVEGGKN